MYQQYGEYDYGNKTIVDLGSSFMSNSYEECVSTLKRNVVSTFQKARNILDGELQKVNAYIKQKFPTASIRYGDKEDYYLNQGCHHADIFPGQREDLGYQCLEGYVQKIYINF